MKKILEPDWLTLMASILQGHCILMLGPDAVTAEDNGKNVPLMELLARELSESLRESDRPPAQSHPTQIAQAFQDEHGMNVLSVQVGEFYGRHATPNQALRDLAALPFKLVISTTPDRLMEQAFRENHPAKNPFSHCYRPRGEKVESVPESTVDHPLVYHLYGDLLDDVDPSIVIAESHLLDLLVAIARQDPPLPRNISSALRDQKTSFLFLGFGLRHWSLRILLHMLQINKQNRSFAWEKFDAPEISSAEQANILFLEKGLKINCYDVRLEEFTAALRQRIEEKQKGRGGGEVAAAAATMRVFLSYASEDVEEARKVNLKLRELKIETWFDKADLGGGDTWESKIELAIEKQADFCLVFNSRALNEKARKGAFVNKEINLALGRQQKYLDPSGGFLIPVRIDDSPVLEALDKLQAVDLTQPAGFEELVKVMRRKYEIRNKRG